MRYWLILFIAILIFGISPSSAQKPTAHFQEIFRAGRGSIHNVEWHPSKPLLLVTTATQTWLYNDHLQDVGHLVDVRLGRFSPDGRYIAGVNPQNDVVIYDASTLQPLKTFHEHTAYVNRLEWDTASQWLASGDNSGKLVVWALDDLQPEWLYQGETTISSLAWSPNNQYLAFAQSHQELNILSLKTHTIDHILPVNDSYARLQWRDNNTLIGLDTYSSDSSRLVVWNIPKQTLLFEYKYGEILDFALSPDNSQILVAQGGWHLFDARTFRLISEHKDEAYSVEVAWAVDGKSFAFGKMILSDDPDYILVETFDSETGQLLFKLPFHRESVSVLAWNSAGKLATVDKQNILRVWDTLLGQSLDSLAIHGDVTTNFDLSADGQYLAIASTYNPVYVWDIDQNHLVSRLDNLLPVEDLKWRPPTDVWNDVPMIATHTSSNDYGASDGKVRIWDGLKGKILFEYTHESPILEMAWRPDGHILGSVEDDYVRFWSSWTGRTATLYYEKDLGQRNTSFQILDWSPDSQKFMITNGEYTIRAFNFFEPHQIYAGYTPAGRHEQTYRNAEWTPDGKEWRMLATYDYPTRLLGMTFNLYYVDSSVIYREGQGQINEDVAQLKGYGSVAYSADFSPDATKFVLLTHDGLLQIRDANMQNPKIVHLWDNINFPYYYNISPVWSPDSRFFALHYQGKTWIIDTNAGTVFDILPANSPIDYDVVMQWSMDSQHLVIADNGEIRVWELQE